jgi:hypothetical protein
MPERVIATVQRMLATTTPLAGLTAMPNVECRTFGGPVWWRDLVNVAGWRLQENVLFGNCRVLDPKNKRKAWGGKRAVLERFTCTVSSLRNNRLARPDRC